MSGGPREKLSRETNQALDALRRLVHKYESVTTGEALTAMKALLKDTDVEPSLDLIKPPRPEGADAEPEPDANGAPEGDGAEDNAGPAEADQGATESNGGGNGAAPDAEAPQGPDAVAPKQG